LLLSGHLSLHAKNDWTEYSMGLRSTDFKSSHPSARQNGRFIVQFWTKYAMDQR